MTADTNEGLKQITETIDRFMGGDTAARVEKPFANEGLESIRSKINELLAKEEQAGNEFHLFNMEIAYALTDWLEALQQVNNGNLEVTLDGTYNEEFVDNVSKALNTTFASLRSLEEERKKQAEKVLEQQAKMIEELSTPIIKVWDSVLVLPIIGIVDSKRAEEMMEKLLTKVVEEQIHYTIVDLTGVTVIDTRTADYFLQMMKASTLIGTKCIVSGISPAIAQTITRMGLEFPTLTMRDLRDALKFVFHEIGLQISATGQ